jgi:hypothetical protein
MLQSCFYHNVPCGATVVESGKNSVALLAQFLRSLIPKALIMLVVISPYLYQRYVAPMIPLFPSLEWLFFFKVVSFFVFGHESVILKPSYSVSFHHLQHLDRFINSTEKSCRVRLCFGPDAVKAWITETVRQSLRLVKSIMYVSITAPSHVSSS